MQGIRQAAQRHWFLIALVVCISSGIAIGRNAAGVSLPISPSWITAFVLFMMAFTLNGDHLRAALGRPTPVIWACLINFGLVPTLAVLCLPLQRTEDFRVGLMIAATVPCTMAAASVWTRKAGGNDAVSLLVTTATNGFCFLITPLWLNWQLRHSVELDLSYLIKRLLVGVLIPMAIGQLLRLNSRVARFADDRKKAFGVAAQSLILTLVFTGAIRAGTRMTTDGIAPDAVAILVVWVCVIAIHVVAFTVAFCGGRIFGFRTVDTTAAAFGASQKTLPIGVLLADEFAVVAPFAVFPMLMYHASQLFVDTALVPHLARWNQSAEEPP